MHKEDRSSYFVPVFEERLMELSLTAEQILKDASYLSMAEGLLDAYRSGLETLNSEVY